MEFRNFMTLRQHTQSVEKIILLINKDYNNSLMSCSLDNSLQMWNNINNIYRIYNIYYYLINYINY